LNTEVQCTFSKDPFVSKPWY